MSVSIHCLLLGRNSKKTAVSSTRFPPPPKLLRHTNKPNTTQFGLLPATIAKIEQIIKLALKANFLPMMSALMPVPCQSLFIRNLSPLQDAQRPQKNSPQKLAPANMPTYAATVNPFPHPGWNSNAACPAMIL